MLWIIIGHWNYRPLREMQNFWNIFPKTTRFQSKSVDNSLQVPGSILNKPQSAMIWDSTTKQVSQFFLIHQSVTVDIKTTADSLQRGWRRTRTEDVLFWWERRVNKRTTEVLSLELSDAAVFIEGWRGLLRLCLPKEQSGGVPEPLYWLLNYLG